MTDSVEKVENAASAKLAQKHTDVRLRLAMPSQSEWERHRMNPLRLKWSPTTRNAERTRTLLENPLRHRSGLFQHNRSEGDIRLVLREDSSVPSSANRHGHL